MELAGSLDLPERHIRAYLNENRAIRASWTESNPEPDRLYRHQNSL